MKSTEKTCPCCGKKFVPEHTQRVYCDECHGDDTVVEGMFYLMKYIKRDTFHMMLYNTVEADLLLEEMREDLGYHMVACLLNNFNEWLVDYRFIDIGEFAKMQVNMNRESRKRVKVRINDNTHSIADIQAEDRPRIQGPDTTDHPNL